MDVQLAELNAQAANEMLELVTEYNDRQFASFIMNTSDVGYALGHIRHQLLRIF